LNVIVFAGSAPRVTSASITLKEKSSSNPVTGPTRTPGIASSVATTESRSYQ
jgi:hypothetical protein